MAERDKQTLGHALDAIYEAKDAYEAAVVETLPINSWVTVKHGDRRTGVWVIDHAYGRVHVRNPDSEKDYWVDASRLVEHDTLRVRAPVDPVDPPERVGEASALRALAEIRDKAENALAAAALPVTPATHVEGLTGMVQEVLGIACNALEETPEAG